jgi:seryl-tRNA synthetase
LDIIDTARGAKVSGSRFGYLKGKGALLEFSLVRWAMDHLVDAGFVPMVPPVLVREHALEGTGFFPEAREQVYEVEKDELFLVGTSEVPMAAYHSDEILETDILPIRYAGFSTCFRREAGTYGKDTAGIFRVHQFDKVEMFVFIDPEESSAEHERLLEVEESLVRELELPYRVVNVAAGDLGASAAKKYDIEAWFPGEQDYREITSCSNTTDYQARRLRIRMRTESGNQIVHTLNGTACAVGRTILAILENHQQPDGSVAIPEALRRYTGFDSITA